MNLSPHNAHPDLILDYGNLSWPLPAAYGPEIISNGSTLVYQIDAGQLGSTDTVAKRRTTSEQSTWNSLVKINDQEKKKKRKILNEYWHETSKQVVREQFDRDERIRNQEGREELARLERFQKQQIYNRNFNRSFEKDQCIEFELVLETDPDTNEILIEVSLWLVMNMKSHQLDGVKFLWNQVFESTHRIASSFDNPNGEDQGGSGAILAHCMGLGKTYTIIAFLHTLFRYPKLTRIHRVLILCPLNTTANWKNEFQHWLDGLEPKIRIYLFDKSEDREEFLRHWYEDGGVLLMGYEMYRQLTYTRTDKPAPANSFSQAAKRMKTLSEQELANISQYRKYLRQPGPDLIICDEGHIIKNGLSAIACTLNKVRTKRRILLTGTPMQNNLQEYYSMVNFCKPYFLGTQHEFSYHFRSPIESGQHRDSATNCVAYMRLRVFALHQRLKSIIHRRNLDVLRSFLPPKFEYALKIRCHPLQRMLYENYLQLRSDNTRSDQLNMTTLFKDYQYLMKIWTHPWLLRPYFQRNYEKDFQDEDENTQTDGISSGLNKNEINDDTIFKRMKNQWWFQYLDRTETKFNIELSGKFLVIKAILDECQSIGDKVLLFSRSLITLDYMEEWLAFVTDPSSTFQWEKGLDYFRIDGSVPIEQRTIEIKSFNDASNHRARLYLISTLAGGLGINLASANRVIILDTSWNPASDLQAMFRAYRLGQSKPVYIYRLMVKGTMEEKLYKRQIIKQAMSDRVIDSKQLERHFSYEELAQLYQFDFDFDSDPIDRSDIDQIEDRILQNLIKKYSDTIVSYCEHDSFLIHRQEENLTEEEQQQAQDESYSL